MIGKKPCEKSSRPSPVRYLRNLDRYIAQWLCLVTGVTRYVANADAVAFYSFLIFLYEFLLTGSEPCIQLVYRFQI